MALLINGFITKRFTNENHFYFSDDLYSDVSIIMGEIKISRRRGRLP